MALQYNDSLKVIIRCLDMDAFFKTSDTMRDDLGKYPTYLYDKNPFNDVQYLFNKNIVFDRTYAMMKANDDEEFEPGITSFDSYSNWQSESTFGLNTVSPNGISIDDTVDVSYLTDKEKEIIYENIKKNVVSLAEKYPDVTFYYFFSPYSAVWWADKVNQGLVYKQIEAEKYIIQTILECNNIKLYSFNMRTDITTDLNNYKDPCHYGQ